MWVLTLFILNFHLSTATEVKVEKQSSNTKLVDRGHGQGEESEVIGASIGGEGGESNGDRRQDADLLMCSPKPAIPVQAYTGGDAMTAEETHEGKKSSIRGVATRNKPFRYEQTCTSNHGNTV